ncbi:MAG: hypothetical protein JAY92_09765 [Candidatus Thiodiazotropha lotti]|nr:hypothetical protein [Candidatus Thiodiazotropha lotti]MCG8002039.1 hypothetical protein [Candidatus Thiodiazotropha lotti]MCW4185657.1 hypothetical protein [Candidatus Thiodiazotropha lotti]
MTQKRRDSQAMGSLQPSHRTEPFMSPLSLEIERQPRRVLKRGMRDPNRLWPCYEAILTARGAPITKAESGYRGLVSMY